MMMNFMDFSMMNDISIYYEEYVEECNKQGIEPMSAQEWWENLE